MRLDLAGQGCLQRNAEETGRTDPMVGRSRRQLCVLGCATDKCQPEVPTTFAGCHPVLGKGVPNIARGFGDDQFCVRNAHQGYTDTFLQERTG